MTTAIKRRRGTTVEHSTFTGLEAEITVDTTKDTVVVHDGATVGGFPLLKENNPSYTGTLTGGTGVVNLGSGQVYKDASGNVGIGLTNPSTALQLTRAGSTETSVKFTNGGAPSGFVVGASSTGAGLVYHIDNQPILFATNNAERMRIDTSGNVGIGTSSPAGKFNVGGGRSFFGANSETYSIAVGYTQARCNSGQTYYIGATDSATPSLVFSNVGGTERMRIDSAGNVGIGTNNPGARFEIRQDRAENSFFDYANETTGGGVVWRQIVRNIANSGTTSVDIAKLNGGAFVINNNDTNAANFTSFGVGASERMRIDSSGNLLVGKSATGLTTNGVEASSTGILATAVSDAGVFYGKTSTTGFGVILTRSDVGGTNTLVGAGFANGTFGTVSDINKKKNIETSRNYLDDIMKLRVVKYNWITDEENSPKELGWIAQEVEEVFPALVVDMHKSKILKKEVFLPMMMKAIQELSAKVDTLQAELNTLKGN